MTKLINGLHHVTTLAGDAQKNIDFYTDLLGLRLVKRTINFDAPDVYHLYYGDGIGTPGTVFTTFPFGAIRKGVKGNGETSTIAFSVPQNALNYWADRFTKLNVAFRDPENRFDEEVLYFEDHDGLGLELVANADDHRSGWIEGPVAAENAIKGFYGVTLAVGSYEKTAGLLTETLEHTLLAEKGNRFRFQAKAGRPATMVDLLWNPTGHRAVQGGGSVHHVAFSTDNDATHQLIREKINALGYQVTEVIDRQYFHSIYFREPAGILFEVATNNPGFTVDEAEANLGEALKLPAWQEKNRTKIEGSLPPIQLKKV